MFIEKIHIQNFRGIEDLVLPLDELTVLVGENNAGKSTIVEALQICLTRTSLRKSNVFSEYDYHLNDTKSEPQEADPIRLTLYFSEKTIDEWPDEITQLLDAAIQVDTAGLSKIIFQIESQYSIAIRDFETKVNFLDLGGNILTRASGSLFASRLQSLTPFFYLSAIRDAIQEFKPKSQFWGPFVKSINIDPAKKAKLEKELEKLNRQVLKSHNAFDIVKKHLTNAKKFLPLEKSDPVAIEALPAKIFDLLGKTQVSYKSKTGVKLPLTRHGEGTKSLSVMLLFDAFIQSELATAYGDFATPILGLEEPEAHLHPCATHGISSLIKNLNGQKIVTTHSGDIVASASLHNIRRLKRNNSKIEVYSVAKGLFTKDEEQKLNHHIRINRGNLFFSKVWILVEGETEYFLLNEISLILGTDIFSAGVSCVEYAQIGLDKAIKLADALGIYWVVMCDGDPKGREYANTANAALGARDPRNIVVLPYGDIEVYLCARKFVNIYEATIATQKAATVSAKKGTLQYWEQVCEAQPKKSSKTKSALSVIQEMERRGKRSVPKELKDIIDRAILLSEDA